MSVPLVVYVSFASLGAGLLSGSGGLPFVFGGILAWWLISPIAIGLGWVPSAEALSVRDWAGHELWSNQVLYSEMLRPLGIGVLIGGAFAGVVASFPALRSAIKSLSQAAKSGGQGGNEELSSRVLYMGMIGSVIILFFAAMTSSPDISIGQGLSLIHI